MTTQPQSVPYPGYTNVAADLTALTANDIPGLPNGFQVYVIAEREVYRLDTANPLTTSSPLIVARGATAGAGKWYRRSRAYVVGNFTLWATPLGGATAGGGDSKMGGFTPGQITVSNANLPDIILDLSADFPTATNTTYSGITDAFGNLWVAGFSSAAFTAVKICKFNLKDILASGSPPSAVTISCTSPIGQVNAIQIAFDKQNSLWICYAKNGANGPSALQRFGQSEYAVTGSPTADVTLTIFDQGVLTPGTADLTGMTFDAAGNLWCAIGLAGPGSIGGILMFSASQLTVTNASILPSVFWNGSNFAGGGISSISNVAFGPTGLIWATSYAGNKIFAWDPRSPVSGNPAPTITLTSTQFNGPWSLCFDTSGNLWVCNDNNSHIYRIPAASLAASGAVIPDVILSQSTILAFPIQITFPNNYGNSGLLPSGIPLVP